MDRNFLKTSGSDMTLAVPPLTTVQELPLHTVTSAAVGAGAAKATQKRTAYRNLLMVSDHTTPSLTVHHLPFDELSKKYPVTTAGRGA